MLIWYSESFQQQWLWTWIHSENQWSPGRRCRRLLLYGSVCGPAHTVKKSRTKTSIKLDCVQIAARQLWPVPEYSDMHHCSPEHSTVMQSRATTYGNFCNFIPSQKGSETQIFMSLTLRVCSLLQLQVKLCTQSSSLRKTKGSSGQKWMLTFKYTV